MVLSQIYPIIADVLSKRDGVVQFKITAGLNFKDKNRIYLINCKTREELNFWTNYFKQPKDVRNFNEVQTHFKNINTLTKSALQLLKLLELRSKARRGDTKISDDNLIKLLKISRATLHRRLKELEDAGFINRYCKRLWNDHCQVRSVRVIRCLRVLLSSRFRVVETMDWKNDPRPGFNKEKIVIKEGQTRKVLEDGWTVNSADRKWEFLGDLIHNGIIDEGFLEGWYELDTKVSFGDADARKILGWYRPDYFKINSGED